MNMNLDFYLQFHNEFVALWNHHLYMEKVESYEKCYRTNSSQMKTYGQSKVGPSYPVHKAIKRIFIYY